MTVIATSKEELNAAFSKFDKNKTVGMIGLQLNKSYPTAYMFSLATLHVLAMMKKYVDYIVFILFVTNGSEKDIPFYEQKTRELFSNLPVDIVYFKKDQLFVPLNIEPFSIEEESFQWHLKNSDIFKNIPLEHIPDFSRRLGRQHGNKPIKSEVMARHNSPLEDFMDLRDSFMWFKGGKDILADLIILRGLVDKNYSSNVFNDYELFKKVIRHYVPIVYWPYGGMVYNKLMMPRQDNHLFKKLKNIDYQNMTIEQLKNMIFEHMDMYTSPPVYWNVVCAFTGKFATTDDLNNKRAMVIIMPRTDDINNEYITSKQYEPLGEYFWIGFNRDELLEIQPDGSGVSFKQVIDPKVDSIFIESYNRASKIGSISLVEDTIYNELVSYMRSA